MQTADAVVIGCGVHGASTAFHLAARGLDVAVVEAKGPAAGASGKSSALVRMHYTVPEEALLAWESWKYFTNWRELVGGSCDFTRTGFVRLVHRSQQDKLRKNVEVMAALGIDTRLVTADDLGALDPEMTVDDVDVAAYEPRSAPRSTRRPCARRPLGLQPRRQPLHVLGPGSEHHEPWPRPGTTGTWRSDRRSPIGVRRRRRRRRPPSSQDRAL